MKLSRIPVVGVFLLSTLLSGASARAAVLKASVFEIGSNRQKLLYRYERTESMKGSQRVGMARYFDLDGKEVCSEELITEDGKLVKYTVEDKQTNELSVAETVGDRVAMIYTKGEKTKSKEIRPEPNFTAGPMMLYYLKEHWDELNAGKDIPFRIPVIDRLDTFGFKFFKIGEETIEKRQAVSIRMKPQSFIIAAIVAPIHLKIEKGKFRLLELSGQILPKKKVGDKWEPLAADMVFHYQD